MTVRSLAITTLAGLISGIVVGGMGSRVIMRFAALADPDRVGIITENGNRVGDITVEGTIGLFVFGGVLSGLVGIFMYLVLHPWLRGTGRWEGLAFGFALLLILGTAIIDAENSDFFVLAPRTMNVALFAVLPPLFGLLFVWLRGSLDGRAGGVERMRGARLLVAVGLAGLGLLTIVMMAAFISGPAFGEDGFQLVGSFVLVMGAAALALAVGDQLPQARSERVRAIATPIGYVALAGALAAGAFRLVDAVATIL